MPPGVGVGGRERRPQSSARSTRECACVGASLMSAMKVSLKLAILRPALKLAATVWSTPSGKNPSESLNIFSRCLVAASLSPSPAAFRMPMRATCRVARSCQATSMEAHRHSRNARRPSSLRRLKRLRTTLRSSGSTSARADIVLLAERAVRADEDGFLVRELLLLRARPTAAGLVGGPTKTRRLPGPSLVRRNEVWELRTGTVWLAQHFLRTQPETSAPPNQRLGAVARRTNINRDVTARP